MQKDQPLKTYDVELNTYAYGGESIGRLPDGRAVFVPFSSPGETVRVRLVDDRKRYARAELLEVLEPTPERITPRCTHYAECGGCHYQHLPYEAQLEVKAEILRDQLERIGGFEDPPVEPAVPSPQPWYYRNHVQFHLDEDGSLGYFKHRSDQVLAIQECHLPEGVLNELWPQMTFDPGTDLERVGLRLGADDFPMLILKGEQPPEFDVDIPLAAVHVGPEGVNVLADTHLLEMEALGRRFQVSAGSFFQVNTAVAEQMVEHLLEHLPLTEETALLELYCGVGLFSAFLAPRVAALTCVESSGSACDDFLVNLEAFDNVTLFQGRAEDVLLDIDLRPDVILVDPPRAGLEPTVVDGILELAPSLLAYVSCDPATLARDGKRLAKGGYQLRQATPFDMFPQTYHIESVSLWGRE